MPTTDDDLRMAPCLGSGALAASGAELIDAARSLGKGGGASALRAWTVASAFGLMEAVFATQDDPRPVLSEGLSRLAATLRSTEAFAELGSISEDGIADDVEAETGSHYGNLFAGFQPEAYFDETRKFLAQRLERNEVAVPEDAEVLDAGCGGGRYTVAWSRLGARHATGVDMSELGINDARRRAEAVGDQVSFDTGSVLALPYGDETFDVVFSNGVLHHTTDWEAGVNELVRVLRPGGLGWLYLIENPGGLFWDTIELLRVITRNESKDAARRALQAIGIPGNRIFYMLDHVMVPINLRLASEEIEGQLTRAGATGIRRLKRGVDFDRVEAIHRGDPYADVKYGVGEHRYVFTR